MSSINPVFILPGVLGEKAEEIATGLHGSATLEWGNSAPIPALC